ncbi:Cupin-8 multi-domain protein [Pyrenophora tritici-repentis]|nr:Cupin-8 multi-domain protein [Pyrenophora tritici-repentis]KAI0613499.1 Cupin-8 multi-domain protein [Pyrenophora tritici-repentis]KAI0625494.1 Cupin-8 multi-domain protein [Pyrenophora tritici-repentis]
MSLRPTQPVLAIPGVYHPKHHPKRRPQTPHVYRPPRRFQVLPKVEHNNERRKLKKALQVQGFSWHRPGYFKSAFLEIPARTKWFTPEIEGFRYPSVLNAAYLGQYGESIVPLEVTRSVSSNDDGKSAQNTFERMEAPLSLLLQHMTATEPQNTQLYLAQHSLTDLAAPLQEDIPTPKDFFAALHSKGDVYGSSLWMGRPPTVTPLHRDPNPNFFVQLAGKKVVRLMQPKVGYALYERMKAQIGGTKGGASMRGVEMMQGKEKELLEDLVWSKDKDNMNDPTMHDVSGFEVTLRPGDALFIPLGWWHAVRGHGKGVNASVNWWFR